MKIRKLITRLSCALTALALVAATGCAGNSGNAGFATNAYSIGNASAGISTPYIMPMRMQYDAPASLSDDSTPMLLLSEAQRAALYCGAPQTDISFSASDGMSYIPLIDASIRFLDATDEYRKYSHWLDLDNAIAGSRFFSGNNEYRTECFACSESGVVCIRLGTGAYTDFSFSIEPYGMTDDCTVKSTATSLAYSGVDGASGYPFAAQFSVAFDGGTVECENGRLTVSNTRGAVVYFASELSGNAEKNVSQKISSAMFNGYTAEKLRHIGSYRGSYDNVYLDLGGCFSNATTDELVKAYTTHSHYASYERYLETLFFQYGRYLEISSGGIGINTMQGRDETNPSDAMTALDSLIVDSSDDAIPDTNGASVVEGMLMRSENGYLSLLPELPEQWENGVFSGLTADGGFTVSAKWEYGRLISAEVYSSQGGLLCVNISDISVSCNGKPVDCVAVGDFTSFETRRGQTYVITVKKK